MAQYVWPPITTTSGPVQFLLNSVLTPVSEDTGTPANSKPLPVTLLSPSGAVFDTNYGTVGASTLRTAAQIGNATGAAAFGSGTVSAQTLRLALASDQLSVLATQTTLAAIAGQLPATLGQKAMAASLAIAIASDQSAIPITAASLPLPTGAATEATLSTLNGKFGSLGQKAMAGSAPVVIASDQSAVPISGTVAVSNFPATQPVSGTVAATQSGTWNITNVSGTVSLPTGASTETTLSALNAKFGSLGQKAMAGSAPVVIASDQSAVPVSGSVTVSGTVAATQSGTWNITNVSGTVSLPTGASTSALQTTGNTSLSSIDGKLASLGQKTMSGSEPVVIASDQSTLPVNNAGYVYKDSNVKSSGTVTSAAWTQIIASTAGASKGVTIFDSSGFSVYLGIGAAASETITMIIPPGGLNGFIPLAIPASSRLSLKAVSTSAVYTSAENIITLLG